jgi:hypothetical protein
MKSSTETENFEDKSLMSKFDFVKAFSIFPALVVMIFIRQRVGFRMLKPNWLMSISAVLFALGVAFPSAAKPDGLPMILFAIVFFGMGLFLRHRRWNEICSDFRWHSRSSGVSYLQMLPLGRFWKSHSRIYRFLDPLLCFLVAAPIWFFSISLAACITWSGLFLFIYEENKYQMSIEHDLDVLDGLIASEVQAETAARFSGTNPDDRQREIEETAGIPTGVAPDLHRQVEIRKAKRVAALEKLVVELPVEVTA